VKRDSSSPATDRSPEKTGIGKGRKPANPAGKIRRALAVLGPGLVDANSYINQGRAEMQTLRFCRRPAKVTRISGQAQLPKL
jgi:hypothetical protein